jgi:hypothetical protein
MSDRESDQFAGDWNLPKQLVRQSPIRQPTTLRQGKEDKGQAEQHKQ